MFQNEIFMTLNSMVHFTFLYIPFYFVLNNISRSIYICNWNKKYLYIDCILIFYNNNAVQTIIIDWRNKKSLYYMQSCWCADMIYTKIFLLWLDVLTFVVNKNSTYFLFLRFVSDETQFRSFLITASSTPTASSIVISVFVRIFYANKNTFY